jgi:hypothetical protein
MTKLELKNLAPLAPAVPDGLLNNRAAFITILPSLSSLLVTRASLHLYCLRFHKFA